MHTHVQPVTFVEKKIKAYITGPQGESIDAVPLPHNTFMQDPAGITAPLVAMPIDDINGSSCFESQWRDFNVTRKIVLIKRGGCYYSQKITLAMRHGALGVIVDNSIPGPVWGGSIGSEHEGKLIPTLMVSQEEGQEWRRLAAKKTLQEVTMILWQSAKRRESWNIISETKEGDPNNVVMLGAHLDSVEMGPGLNDNGSGSTALMEIARAFQKYTGYRNKIRFAWWGAEEYVSCPRPLNYMAAKLLRIIMRGSNYYVKNMTTEERQRIRFYFNYDMIGSRNPDWAVQAHTEADRYGAQRLWNYLHDEGGKNATFE